MGTIDSGTPPAETSLAVAGAPRPADDPLDRAVLGQLEADLGPEILGEVLAQFLDEAMTRARCLAAATSDRATLAREAHTLKSTAATFGARHLAVTARQVEASFNSGATDDQEAERLRRSLPDLVQSVAHALRGPGGVTACPPTRSP